MKSKQARQLNDIFASLDEANQRSVLAFAEFLLQRQGADGDVEVEITEPIVIAAAENESIVGALRRLSQSYPMLDKATLLNATSPIMAQHIMQGREKTDAIAELEQIFEQHYQRYKQEKG